MLVRKSLRRKLEELLTLPVDGEDRFDLTWNPCNANFAR